MTLGILLEDSPPFSSFPFLDEKHIGCSSSGKEGQLLISFRSEHIGKKQIQYPLPHPVLGSAIAFLIL
jgi:hypothetical protein